MSLVFIMDSVHITAWKATQQLCGSMDLEKALTGFFGALREVMPLTHIFLGRFSEEEKTCFVIAHTSQQGTIRLFRSFPFTDEQFALAKAWHFFNPDQATDALITDATHPLAPLYRHGKKTTGHPGYPFYAHRPIYENTFYGGGTFHFAEGTRVTDRMIAIIHAVAAPLSTFINAWFQYWELQKIKEQISRDNQVLRQKLSGLGEVQIIGANGGLKAIMEQLRLVAPLDVSVLIRGETGTGKELAAKALHDLSPHRDRPFVAVNCGAIPSSLIDSELFGHTKGAFTGATNDHKGRFERAEGGTLFLDEVAELPLEVQARLLRVIQEHIVERVGGNKPIPVRFRLVAATHRNLENMVEHGTFREDLYYRLRVVSLAMPPLRKRVQDISLLLQYFLEQAANRFSVLTPSVPEEERKRLLAYAWPGNIRELQNTAEEALALCGNGPLHFHLRDDMARELDMDNGGRPQGDNMVVAHNVALRSDSPKTRFAREAEPCWQEHAGRDQALFPYDAMMHDYLEDALARCRGKIRGAGGAAELLGLNYSTLRDKLKKYGVPYGRNTVRSPAKPFSKKLGNFHA